MDENETNMNRLLIRLLLIALIVALAFITSFLTGFIIIGKDMAEIDTVGVIAHRGFPVWFAGVAPGISIMGSWKQERFLLNTLIWTAAYLIGAIAIRRNMRNREKEEKPQQAASPRTRCPERRNES